jgi:hypothetical protein
MIAYMTIKERVEEIQKLTDTLQWDINQMDTDFRFYNIIILEMSDPFTIYILRKDESRDNAQVASLFVDLSDLFYCNSFVEDLEKEEAFLRKISTGDAQIKEFQKIRELFGV